MSEVQYFKLCGEINTKCNIWLKKEFLPGFNERKAFLEHNFPGLEFRYKKIQQYHMKPFGLKGNGDCPRCFQKSTLSGDVFYPNRRTVGGKDAINAFDEFEFEYQPTMIMSRIHSDVLKSTSMFYGSSFSLNYFLKTWYLKVEINAMKDVDNYPSYLVPVHPIDYHSKLNMAKRLNMFVLLES